MYGIYYNTPINFKQLIEKRDVEKTNLDKSIAKYINLIVTSSFGECKFNEMLGCKIWEMDFDLLSDTNSLRDKFKNDIKEAIIVNESRLNLLEVDVIIGVGQNPSYNNSIRLKKKVTMKIEGLIKKTNRPFNFYGHFFIGPLSQL
ncbi:GPW/gp25 family protein [Apibacter sp.]|uniref:GPW/gp25 family protein n=1 Tax=Apibacter sp. TaxID=2023709 RepID=UPI0025E280A7|nr:GPW/gp25 family protein [Apibacter sp.]MCT6869882.1 GPW/gp25 family protein [Apibacter sp.]